jgi:acetolactate synthase I/II/III large subunit
MTAPRTVGDLVAEFLHRCGVTEVFGLVSVHNLPIADGLAQAGHIRFVMARGEMGAGHMADGVARAGNRLGVVVSSTGPGAANTVPGLVEARFASSPVLHITGQSATAHLGRDRGTVHEVPDQLGMLAAVGKSAFRITSAREAWDVLRRAAADALSAPRGPVSVEIPIDVQRAAIAPGDIPEGAFSLPITAPVQPDATALDELAERVLKARRPLIWAGHGAAGASAQLQYLLALGFGMVTSWAGRGVVDDAHPQNLGALNGSGSQAVQQLYDSADLLLVVGSRLRGHETQDMQLRLPPNLLHIDIDPAANGRTYANQGFFVGDAALTLQGLLDRVRGHLRIDPEFPDQVQKAKQAALEEHLGTLGPYASFPPQLRAAMPADAVWVRDVTMAASTWGHRAMPLQSVRDNIYPVGAGIGLGLPLAIGAAFGVHGKRKVVMMAGDGGFALNLPELWTAVQERLDILIIVMNDRGYGVIKHMQDAMYQGRRRYGDLPGPDLRSLAALAGLPFSRVSRAAEFGAHVASALAVQGPALVEVDMTAIGEFPAYFPYSRMLEAARQPAAAPATA